MGAPLRGAGGRWPADGGRQAARVRACAGRRYFFFFDWLRVAAWCASGERSAVDFGVPALSAQQAGDRKWADPLAGFDFFFCHVGYVKRLGGKWANPVREWSPSVATTGGSLKERYNDRPSDFESK